MTMLMELRRPVRGLIPWEVLHDAEHQFESLLGWRSMPTVWTRTPEDYVFAPPVEMLEKDDKFIVKAELPGMNKEDIDVSVTNNTLSISGERKEDREVKDEDFYLREHTYGSFCRTIDLPTPVDEKKVEATYENGILEIIIPKSPEAKAKRVSITTGRKQIGTKSVKSE